MVISHLDGGYFLNLTAMLKDALNPSPSLLSKGRFREIAMEEVNEVALTFPEQLQKIDEEDLLRPTFQKQCLSKKEKLEILFQDLKFVLGLLDQAIQAVNSSDDHIKFVASITRFGQKQDCVLYLGSFLEREQIEKVSVYFACTMNGKDKNTHLLLSRYGGPDISNIQCVGHA